MPLSGMILNMKPNFTELWWHESNFPNYLPLAYHLAHGNHTGLGKLFLGEIYRYLHLTTSNLLNHKKLRTGGPWWFIQLWAQLYFQHQIPNFQNLTKNSFPDENVKPIRCTSYGQALFSLPGSRLNPIELSNQAMKPINQL